MSDAPIDIDDLLTEALSGKTVLLLEDRLPAATRVMNILYKYGVAMVQHVISGDFALKEAQDRSFDLLLLDRQVPGLDGLDVLLRLRKSKRGSYRAPALILTSDRELNSEPQKARGMMLGANDYVDKAIGDIELVARIARCLKKDTSTHDSSMVHNGPLVVDEATRVVTLFGKRVKVGTQGFDILLELVRYPGNPFTKDDIYRLCNPHAAPGVVFDGADGAAFQAIRRVREALLEAENSPPVEPRLPEMYRPLIQTVTGTGYMMRDLRGKDC